MKMKNVLNDLQRLEYETGRHSGRWYDDFDKLDSALEWNAFITSFADTYEINYDDSNLNFDDAYTIDEWTFDLKKDIENELKSILNIK